MRNRSTSPEGETTRPRRPFSPVAARQQAFAAPFTETGRDEDSANELLEGNLKMHPHPTWRIPENITWHEDPFGEPNWRNQFHMLRWLDPLRRLADKGDPRGIDLWVNVVRSWIHKNPPGARHARSAWRDRVDSMRTLTFCAALPALAQYRDDALSDVLESLMEHGQWLADPTHIGVGNHALEQHQALLVVGSVTYTKRWRDLAIERLTTNLPDFYDEQGINEEGALEYHILNHRRWNIALERIRRAGGQIPATSSRIEKAIIEMAHATRPDGYLELIGDTETLPTRNLIHPCIKWVRSGGREGVPPAQRVKIYDAGYIFGRSGWGRPSEPYGDATFYSLRFGPQNRIHGHRDGGGITLYAHRTPILVDTGKYAYDKNDRFRQYVQSRAGHNSIEIPNREYIPSTSVKLCRFRLSDRNEDFEFQDTGYSGVHICRRVIVSSVDEFILVHDTVRSDIPVTARQLWHLAPDFSSRIVSSDFVKTQNSAATAWINSLTNDSPKTITLTGSEEPTQGWISMRWRELSPTDTIIMEKTGTNFEFLTLIDHARTVRDFANFQTIPCRSTRYPHVKLLSWSDGTRHRTAALAPHWFHHVPTVADPEDVAASGIDSYEPSG